MTDYRLWLTVGAIAVFAVVKGWPYIAGLFRRGEPNQIDAFGLAMQLVEFFRTKGCQEGEKLARDTARHIAEASCDERKS